jgi:hypothetical protein
MRRTRTERNRSGTVLVVACVMLPVFCGVAAIAIDVALLTNSGSRLQNAADAASLAAVLELWDQRAAGCDEEDARAAAEAEAASIVSENYPESGTDVAFGLWNGSSFTATGCPAPANAVRVRASRNAHAPGGADRTVFAGFFGIERVAQQREAVARFTPRSGGLIPFALWEGDLVPVGQYLTMYDDTQVTPGVFGLLDFDGGANSAGDLVEWTENGYPGLVWIPPDPGYLVVEGNTGFIAALNVPVDDHIQVGDTLIACVYANVWGTGENTYFQIVGFVKVVITARGHTHVDGEPKKFIEAQIAGKYIPGSGETTGTMRDFMDLQLVA